MGDFLATKDGSAVGGEYGAEQIKVLKGLEGVRKRLARQDDPARIAEVDKP